MILYRGCSFKDKRWVCLSSNDENRIRSEANEITLIKVFITIYYSPRMVDK